MTGAAFLLALICPRTEAARNANAAKRATADARFATQAAAVVSAVADVKSILAQHPRPEPIVPVPGAAPGPARRRSDTDASFARRLDALRAAVARGEGIDFEGCRGEGLDPEKVKELLAWAEDEDAPPLPPAPHPAAPKWKPKRGPLRRTGVPPRE